MKNIKLLGLLLAGTMSLSGIISCTDLEEDILGSKYIDESEPGQISGTVQDLLNGTYNQLGILSSFDVVFSLQECSSDELQMPTRGADWGDFGRWRQLHQHQWTPRNTSVVSSWDELNRGSYRANQVISLAGTNKQIEGEGRFLRAFYMFHIVDLFGQVPFRDVADSPDKDPIVMNRKEATAFIIKDLEVAIANLASGAFNKGNKEAAEALLAKVYLNKAVFDQAPESPAGPFTFAKADMDKVIQYSNEIINSKKYTIQPKGEYFKMFYWNNTVDSKESIFGVDNTISNQPATLRSRVFFGTHYKQFIGGWNGGTTLASFYDYFDKADERIGGDMPGFTDKTGMKVGFLIGPQFDKAGAALTDRVGKPLSFTRDVNLLYAGEANGIRIVKFPLDPANIDQCANDYVPLRYADVILMKAEAILRGGTDPAGQTAVALVNSVRANRGAAALTTIDLPELLKERGRELYWEGWRRNDQVRFGTFLDPMDNKPAKSADNLAVYPIPQKATSTNPNLKQNFGY